MIKLLCIDVDGVLTDGTYFMCEHGSVHKGFYSRDFHGMHKLHKTGVKIAVVSYSSDPVIKKQCDRAARYALVFTGIRDKKKLVYDSFIYHGPPYYKWDEIAYIGDDDVDIELLKAVGLAACPYDAHETILELLHGSRSDRHILRANGGHGAVREFTDYIIMANKAEQDAN